MSSLPALCLLCAVGCLAAPVRSQDTEQRREAVVDFKRYFKQYKDTSQKVEAVRTLKGAECAEAAEVLLELLDHRDPEVRAAALQVVSAFADMATFAPTIELLPKERDDRKRALWIEVLGNARVAAAVPTLLELLQDRRASPGVKYQTAKALGKIGDLVAADALGELLRDADPLVRLAAVDAVGQLRLTQLSDEVIGLLEDKDWKVRSGAAGTLGTLRSQEAVEPLIALMKKGGRLREDAAEALFSITALDFGTDPEMWERQWQRLESIDWRIPTEAELEKAKESRRRAEAYYGKSRTTTFSGISTTSTRVLFIIDVSGSMEDQITEREKFEAGYRDFAKLTIVKTELVRTIEGLEPETNFNVVSFATDLKTWKKQLVPANIVNKSSAASWVGRLEPIGGGDSGELAAAGLGVTANIGAGKTNTHKALMYPFGIDPSKPKTFSSGGSSKNGDLDTVFFLSDGRPSTGVLVDTLEILDDVRRINETHKIVFHAIAIGDFQKEFVRSLALQNGGVFVDLGQ